MKLAHTLLLVPALALLAACGADSDASSAMADRESAALAPLAPELRDGSTGGGSAPGSTAYDAAEKVEPASAAAAQTRAIISKGQVSLESEDLEKARFELQKLLTGWGGTIASEESSADEDGRTERQQLELRVPSKHFGAAMDEISGLGTLVDRSRSSEDVTTQVIDVDARVRSQRLSLARVQALLERADSLSQVISIEAQLSRRQAELDSLEQQQKYLADQTAESTITVFLEVPDGEDGKDEEDAGGFVAGLRDGWDAFRSTATGVLQGLGAVLPFGVVLAVVGVPAALVWRRRRTLT